MKVFLFLILFYPAFLFAQNDTTTKKLQWYVSAGLNTHIPFYKQVSPVIDQGHGGILSGFNTNIAFGGAIGSLIKIKVIKSFSIETGLMFTIRSSSYLVDSLQLRELQMQHPGYYSDNIKYYYFPLSVEIPVIFLYSKKKWEFGVGCNIRTYTLSCRKITDINNNIFYNYKTGNNSLPDLYPVVKVSYKLSKHRISIYGYYRESMDILLSYSFEIHKK